MRLFLITIVVILFTGLVSAQSNIFQVKLENNSPNYISITDVAVSQSHYFEQPESDYYGGFKFRAIITVSEIYYSLFFEEISLDVEGSNTKISWSREFDLEAVLDKYNLSHETTSIENLYWKDVYTFRFSLEKNTFEGTIDRQDVSRISLCKIERNCTKKVSHY
jgi:hypothetical protein